VVTKKLCYYVRTKQKQVNLIMIRDIDDKPKETAKAKAERMWRNHNIEMRLKEEIKTAKAEPKKPKELQIAQMVTNEKPDKRGSVIRSQTKFAKYITEMMEGHTKRNKEKYLLLIAIRKRKLRIAKIKLLQVMEAQQSKPPPPLQKKDLFG
jgi:hypothetical protein